MSRLKGGPFRLNRGRIHRRSPDGGHILGGYPAGAALLPRVLT